jgi:hypothetical protein
MGVPTAEVGYTSATTGREDHKDHKGHVAELGGGENTAILFSNRITVNAIPVQAWTGPEGSRKLELPDL